MSECFDLDEFIAFWFGALDDGPRKQVALKFNCSKLVGSHGNSLSIHLLRFFDDLFVKSVANGPLTFETSISSPIPGNERGPYAKLSVTFFPDLKRFSSLQTDPFGPFATDGQDNMCFAWAYGMIKCGVGGEVLFEFFEQEKMKIDFYIPIDKNAMAYAINTKI